MNPILKFYRTLYKALTLEDPKKRDQAIKMVVSLCAKLSNQVSIDPEDITAVELEGMNVDNHVYERSIIWPAFHDLGKGLPKKAWKKLIVKFLNLSDKNLCCNEILTERSIKGTPITEVTLRTSNPKLLRRVLDLYLDDGLDEEDAVICV